MSYRPSFIAEVLGKDDNQKANQALKSENAALNRLEKDMKRMRLILDGRKVKDKMGVFSPDIWARGAVHQQEQSLFTAKLPIEVQMMVVSYLSRPDQVALAVTCKAHAKVDELNTMKLSSVKRKPVTQSHRLALLIRLSTWMKPGDRLCYSCVCYIGGAGTGANWAGNKELVTSGLSNAKAIREGLRCSICRHREWIKLKSTSAECRIFTKRANSVLKGQLQH